MNNFPLVAARRNANRSMLRCRITFSRMVGPVLFSVLPLLAPGSPLVMPPASTTAGYVGRLLINEVAFPGEWGYISVEDTKASLEQMLLVLDGRLRHVPPPYIQRHVAAITTDNIIDIITVGGVRGQFDGFFRDDNGRPAAVPRVEERINNLVRIANQGQPGRFFLLLTHATDLAANYVRDFTTPADRHARVVMVQGIPATGRSFGWMTNKERFHPGGNFLRIEDHDLGYLSGNRFFTLRREPR